MREPGSILLVSCYELGHQPVGLAMPLAFLERAGYMPCTIDISVEPLDVETLKRAQFVGISVPMHTALRLGVRLAERIRSVNPSCHICFYGLYAWLNSEYLLEHVADSVIGGEYEESIVALVRALEEGGRIDVEGVRSRRSPPSVGPPLKRLSFTVPSRSMLPPLERYARLERDGAQGLVGYVEASRGCLHGCLHCPIPPVYGGRFFVVPKDVVLEDIRRFVAAGATHITFGDPDFLNGPGHSLAIARAMHAEFPDVTFDFTTKVEHILRYSSLFCEFSRLGCIFVVSAIESLSDAVLANLKKGHTRADIFAALAITREAGIALRPSLLPFTPWTTIKDYIELLDFVQSEGLIYNVDPVQYSIRLLIPPGSLLLSSPQIRPYLGPLDQETFSYRWTHPDPRMDRLHQDVSSLVERSARENEDPYVTFYRVRALALAAMGERADAKPPPAPPNARRAPRLTEPWFC